MTPDQIKSVFRYGVLAGFTRLASTLMFSVLKIKGIYYLGNCISHILFWIALDIVFRKVEFKTVGLGRMVSTLFLMYSLNDFIDEMFFNPASFGGNEVLFFFGSAVWFFVKYYKAETKP